MYRFQLLSNGWSASIFGSQGINLFRPTMKLLKKKHHMGAISKYFTVGWHYIFICMIP